MVASLEYWVVNDRYYGRLPEVPGVSAEAGTRQELKRAIRDAHSRLVLGNRWNAPQEGSPQVIDIDLQPRSHSNLYGMCGTEPRWRPRDDESLADF